MKGDMTENSVESHCSHSLRTRKGREAEVIGQVKSHGGFSVFWATENQAKANAIMRLSSTGKIERTKLGRYPWCPYRLIE